MSRWSKAGFAAVLLSSVGISGANATELLIFHNWSSPAEVAALTVLRTAFEAGGDTWTEFAIPHDSGSNVSLINLVTGGNPPDIFLEASPWIYRDLMAQGLALPVTQHFEQTGVVENLPELVLRSITVDGEILKIPTAVHIDGTIFYNKQVAEAVGVDPTTWTSLDDFFAVYDQIKDAGYIPLAIGGEKWQIGYLFHAIMASETGGAIFDRFYAGEPDASAIDTPEMRQVLDRMRQIQQHTDEGSPGRKWNDTTNLVITGQALMQLHGDWMKGEFRAAGKVAGTDFGCMNIPGTKGVVVTVDAWGLLNTGDAEKEAAQMRYASMIVDPAVQAEFAAAKGSSPVRLNSPTENLDVCNAMVHDLLADPAIQHQNPHNTADPDWMNGVWDIIDAFWNDPEMTNDDVIAELQDLHSTIFSE